MNITVQGQTVTLDSNVVGYELDNLVDTITLTILDSEGNPDTTTPTEQQWAFTMLVYMCLSNTYQSIAFTGSYPTLTATLTSEQLPVNGRYISQFQMTLDEQVAHTEQFEFWVNDTINPNETGVM